jgi:C1A family cysteine protease
MPIGLSDCGCSLSQLSSENTQDQMNTPWISDADLMELSKQATREQWTFTVGKNPATQQGFTELCGLVEPENWWVDASFDPCIPTSVLPSRFDWRELGGCTPVKNQGGCGSCWAFGTVAPLECNIKINDGLEVNLSEQWLVNCNLDGWGCDGGWWAHDYHQWKTDCFNGTGAVLEKEFPYKAKDLICDGPYLHSYSIDSWRYIGFSQHVPSTDAIKQAIMTYGPVSVACAVTDAFGAYTGGVFNKNDPDAQINHAVALVGWDDTQGTHGVWFLRNSWGSGWGEDGYMRIEYGVCKVGYGACYVVYPMKTKIEINSGLFGVNIGIRNVGNTVTTDIQWQIVLNGSGLLRAFDISFKDSIEALEPGAVMYQRIPNFGFGPLSISVTAQPSNAGKTTNYAEGFVCGLFFVVLRN